MLAIGGAAGAASFTHVRDVAAAHGQPGWLAWADAIVLELMSIASGLELRRRKRASVSVVFPATVLACAVTLSLAAQVVEAEPSPIGWIAAAVPALGFLVMVKIALGYTAESTPPQADTETSTAEPADQSITVTLAEPDGDRDGRSTPPDSDRPLTARSVHDTGKHQDHHGPDRSRTGGPVHRHRSSRRGPSTHPTGTDELLAAARGVRERRAAEGKPLTRAVLAAALRSSGHTVSNTRASHLLKILKADQPAASPSHAQEAGDSAPPMTPVPGAPTPTTALDSHQRQPQSGEPTP
ncbi:DUF2637 domain-containing protein [Verrucosispora sp. WMMA2121]|uniref:DUF2637 domain-containing protein n=1 Tax=Verrucosispora sp. WMMA2121 TaxID=3015164 RepID=UPI0022B71A4F|nr:DUF2637 domain-containing protein [Verrucosispora sp. WMMA2121]MCZ7420585.1 DUF2637 domain-containing protein [Verrucosispora sp. WMMA2121]